MKRKIPLLIASLTGAVLIVAHFVPLAESWSEQVVAWFNILAAVALVLGGCNLMKMQLQKVAARKPGWGYAAVTVIAFVVTLVVGLGKVGVDPPERDPTMTWAGQYNEAGSAFDWIFEFVMTPLQATMFALLAFFVSSAAFRAFRAKNAEASLLLATAFLVLLGRTYAGIFLTSWADDLPPPWHNLRLDRLTENVIQDVFNLAGVRAINLGIALGVAATSLKVLLGLDRSYLGDD